jgi:hypothetical protein
MLDIPKDWNTWSVNTTLLNLKMARDRAEASIAQDNKDGYKEYANLYNQCVLRLAACGHFVPIMYFAHDDEHWMQLTALYKKNGSQDIEFDSGI